MTPAERLTYFAPMQRKLRGILNEKFRKSPYTRPRTFLYTSVQGPGGVTYGSYKTVYADELAERTYTLEYWDGAVTIHYIDYCHWHPL